jgi:hypothetical protein
MPKRSTTIWLAAMAALLLSTGAAHAQHMGGGGMGGMHGGGGGMHGAGPGGGMHAGGPSGGGWNSGGGWHGGGGWNGGGNWHGGSGWHGGGWHGSNVIIGVGPYWGPYWGGWGYPYYYPYYPPYGSYPPAYYGQDSPYPDSQSEYVEREPSDGGDAPQPGDSSSSRYWYYCPSAHGYYPDVRKCSKNWIKVPARSTSTYQHEEDR